MNNRGWGLQAMILWCAVLGILLIIASVLINGTINNLYAGNGNRNSNGSSVIKKEDKEDANKEDKNEIDASDYEKYLETMVNASKNYVEKEYANDYANAAHLKLSTKILINNDYMDRIVDPNNKLLECIGYVAVDYINNELTYKAFLKCGDNYETEGFVIRHAE